MSDENAKNFLENFYNNVCESLDDLTTDLSEKQVEWVDNVGTRNS